MNADPDPLCPAGVLAQEAVRSSRDFSRALRRFRRALRRCPRCPRSGGCPLRARLDLAWEEAVLQVMEELGLACRIA